VLIFGFVANPGKLEDYLKWAAQNGFSHIEIDGTLPSNLPDQFTKSRVRSIRDLADHLEITLSYHTSYAINLAEPFRELREAGTDLVGRCIDLSEKLEANWVTVHPGYKVGWSDQKSERLTYFNESLNQLLQIAENYGISIAVENLNRLIQGEIYYLGDCFNELDNIFASSSSKLLKMALDFGHANLNEGIDKYLRKYPQRIICTHIHDNAGRGVDEHLPLGKGSVNWEETCKVIKEVDYNGPLCLEVYSDEAKVAGMKLLGEYLTQNSGQG
jgi:sugar phosphate isomerase/epimerase